MCVSFASTLTSIYIFLFQVDWMATGAPGIVRKILHHECYLPAILARLAVLMVYIFLTLTTKRDSNAVCIIQCCVHIIYIVWDSNAVCIIQCCVHIIYIVWDGNAVCMIQCCVPSIIILWLRKHITSCQ